MTDTAKKFISIAAAAALAVAVLASALPTAATIADPVLSPTSGKVGDTFTLTGGDGNFSYTENKITYYDSAGAVIITEKVPGYGDQVQSLFPVLMPGSYSLTVTNPEAGWVSSKLAFTIVSGGQYPKISVLVGVSGLGQIPEIQEVEAKLKDELQLKNINLNIDRLAVILLSSRVSGGYDPLPAKVTFGAQSMDAVALSFYQGIVVTSVPAGLSGSTSVKVKINNYETPAATLDILDPSKYSLQTPNGRESWNGGDTQVMKWTGDVPALAALIKGRNFFKSLAGEQPEGEIYPLSEDKLTAPFNWTVPEAMPGGDDYKLGLVFYKGLSPEDLEKYANNYTPDSPPLALFFHLVLSRDFFTITEARHPLGTLIRDETGTVYEIINTARMGFPSVSVFRSYGFEFKDVVPAIAADMALPLAAASYATGDLIVDHGTVYIIDSGQKFAFSSKKVFDQQGYKFSNVFPGDLSAYSLGGVLSDGNAAHVHGSLVVLDGAVFRVWAPERTPIASEKIFLSHKYRFGRVVPGNAADRALPARGAMGFADGSLLNFNGQVSVVQDGGARKAFPDAETFHRRGYKFSNLINVTAEDLLNMPEQPPYQPVPRGLIGNARGNSRDAKRISDTRQLMTAFELYYNEHNMYPPTMQAVTGGPSPYMSVLPTAPMPPDGECTEAQNTYTYTSVQGGQNYQLAFCLGEGAAGLDAGPHTASASGILGVTTRGPLPDLPIVSRLLHLLR